MQKLAERIKQWGIFQIPEAPLCTAKQQHSPILPKATNSAKSPHDKIAQKCNQTPKLERKRPKRKRMMNKKKIETKPAKEAF